MVTGFVTVAALVVAAAVVAATVVFGGSDVLGEADDPGKVVGEGVVGEGVLPASLLSDFEGAVGSGLVPEMTSRSWLAFAAFGRLIASVGESSLSGAI